MDLLRKSRYRTLLIFYSAYEISTFHKKVPPPKEILEDVSAKGGDLLNRTLENFDRPINREAENLANGFENENDNSDQERQRTPSKEDKMEIDDPGSTGGRVTRGEIYCQESSYRISLSPRCERFNVCC